MKNKNNKEEKDPTQSFNRVQRGKCWVRFQGLCNVRALYATRLAICPLWTWEGNWPFWACWDSCRGCAFVRSISRFSSRVRLIQYPLHSPLILHLFHLVILQTPPKICANNVIINSLIVNNESKRKNSTSCSSSSS